MADRRIGRMVSKRKYTKRPRKNNQSPQLTEASNSMLMSPEPSKLSDNNILAQKIPDLKFQLNTPTTTMAENNKTWPENITKRAPKVFKKIY